MEPCQMKLAEIDLEDLQQALRMERTAWIKVANEERRRPTDADNVHAHGARTRSRRDSSQRR